MVAENKPNWVSMKPAELEKIILELAKSGETPAKIGLILRDKHGIPKAKLLGKRICQILKASKIEIKSEEKAVEERIQKLEKHISKNSHDYTAKRSMTKTLWLRKKK